MKRKTKTDDVNPPKNHFEDEVAEVTPEQWGGQFQAAIVAEVYRLLNEQEQVYGAHWGKLVEVNVIAGIISAAVYRCISERTLGVKDTAQQTEINREKYRELKHAIQEAVSAGFEGAFRTHTGDHGIEYSCQIQLVPKPVNELAC
jgi:hypothetical protein